MTYKDYFKNLAEKENGEFYFKDEDVSIGMGVRSPDVVYKVTFNYKNNLFTIINRTGTAYVATITCELSPAMQPIAFEISTRSHIQQLFSTKQTRLKINAENANIKYYLNKNHSFETLSQIAKKENFSPYIACELNEGWRIEAKYHLEFDNWTDPIGPIIDLYKGLIDEFEKRITNMSEKAYRELK